MADGALIEDRIAHAKAQPGTPVGATALLRLRSIAQRIAQASAPVPSRSRLDSGGFEVLAALRVAPPPHRLRPTALYRMLGISSGGLTGRLDRLELLGLVRRSAAEDDRRGSWIALTDKGSALAEQAMGEELALLSRIAGALTEREQWVLATLLRKLEGSLGEAIAAPQGRL